MNTIDILDNISTSVIIINKFTEIVYINAAGENFFHNSKANLKNKKINTFFAKENNEIINQIYDAIALNQKTISRDIEVSLKSKIKYHLNCNIQIIYIEDEKHVLLEINLLRNKKNIEENLKFIDRSNTSKIITRSIAHEIKNPLGGIKGAAQLLESEIEDKFKDYTNIIIYEADRLKNYIDKMLGPKEKPSFKFVNLHSITDKIINISNITSNKKIMYIKDYDPSIPDLYIDENMINQSLLNLVKNANEAVSNNNGIIIIKTRVERNYTINKIRHKLVSIISVIDNGNGINDDIKNKLFLPLVTNKADGSGLGLSISQRLISANNGIIDFEEEINKTIFKIILPIEKY